MNRHEFLLHLYRVTDRRSFLRAAGLLGAGAAVSSALRPAFRLVHTDADDDVVSCSRVALGTFVTVAVAQAPRDVADAAIAGAFAEMERLAAILSRHDGRSALSTLNAEGRLSGPPPELMEVVSAALAVHRQTDGAFDPTVKPLIDVLEAVRGGTPPSDAEILEAVGRVGATRVALSAGHIRFEGDGMGMTLDGVAKGYIVDRMSDVLVAQGAPGHLINAGGDIRASREGSGRPWTIAIEDPRKRGNYPDVIRMRNGAIATSGSYENFYDADRTHHHIVDPCLGASPRHAVSVSVRARCVMDADALSTAVFVMEPERGLRLIDSIPRVESMVVNDAGHIRCSRGWSGAAG